MKMTLFQIISFAISIFISAYVSSQNAYNKTIINEADGIVEEYYSFGGIASRYEVVNGKIHGERRSFYRSGSLLNIELYENGFLHGTITGFNRRGDTVNIEIYKHDTLLYLKQYYYYSNHKLKITSTTSFLVDSTLRANPFNISEGFPRVKLSHEDILKSTNNYNTTKRFYRNGRVKSVALFHNDDKHGHQVSYYRKGGVHIESNYNNNQLDGIFREYYKSGNVKLEFQYLNEELHGFYREYGKNGELTTEQTYVNGQFVE